MIYITRKYKRLAKLSMLQIMSNKNILDGLTVIDKKEAKRTYLLDECLFFATLYAKAGQKKLFENKKTPIIVDFKKLRKVLSYYIDKELKWILEDSSKQT